MAIPANLEDQRPVDSNARTDHPVADPYRPLGASHQRITHSFKHTDYQQLSGMTFGQTDQLRRLTDKFAAAGYTLVTTQHPHVDRFFHIRDTAVVSGVSR